MRLVAYVLMLLAAATLLPWLAMAPMSLMAFDSGGNAAAYALVGAMLLYPVWLIYWLRSAWSTLKAGNETSAIVRSLVGAAPALIIAGIIAGSSIVPVSQKPPLPKT